MLVAGRAHPQRPSVRFCSCSSRIVALCLVSVASAGLISCEKHVQAQPRREVGALRSASAVTLRAGSVTAAAAEDGQWTLPGKDYENTRYVRLHEIDTSTVKNLKLVWSMPTGVKKGHEAAPLVVADTMFVVTPFPNQLLAFDLKSPGAAPKWKYEPPLLPAAEGVACCDVVNRGASYASGRVYFNTLDDQTVAVDAQSGHEVWRTKLGEITRGETITMAPLVVGETVLVGNSGGELGVRGWLCGLDASSGKLKWRAYATGPDSEVLIGPDFKPFYESERGHDLGVTTWPVDQWKIGGGNAWGFVSYDAELDLIYYGTANPGPWNHEARPGDNKWTAGIFARHPEDGRAVWFYQTSPHDVFDHDGVNENVLVDLTIAGKTRKALVHADRNGYVYVVDRTSGEVLSATPFVPISSSRGVNLKTGRLELVPDMVPRTGHAVRNICPSAPGAKDWQPMAFSGQTGLFYIPHQRLCMDMEITEANYIAGTPYVGANARYRAAPGGHRGELTAWDPVQARAVWSVNEEYPVWSGAVATDGGLVFYGTLDGWFKAVDARSGKELWRFKTQSGIISQPVSYRGPDGKQYVAVLDGIGGWVGATVVGRLDARDQSAANGFGHPVADLKHVTQKGGAIYVFGLP